MQSYTVLTWSFGEVMKLGFGQCQVRDRPTQRFCWLLFLLANYALDAPAVGAVVAQCVQFEFGGLCKFPSLKFSKFFRAECMAEK